MLAQIRVGVIEREVTLRAAADVDQLTLRVTLALSCVSKEGTPSIICEKVRWRTPS